MANTIPGTKFATLAPPGETGQIAWSPPSEGAGRQAAAGLEKLGGAVFAYALNVERKKMVAEVSQRKRQIDELGWAARESVIGDNEADGKVWEKFSTDARQISQSSEYKDVNETIVQYLNDVLPNWQHGIRMQSLGIQSRNAEYQSEYEAERLLAIGRVDLAGDIYEKSKKLNPEKSAYYDEKIKTAQAESHILIAERLIENGNYDEAITELDKTSSADLTSEQIRRKNILANTAEKQKSDVDETLSKDVLNKIADGMPLNEVGELIKQTIGIDGEQKTKLMQTAVAADNIWQKTKESPFHVTQDYEKLTDTWHKVRMGEIKDFQSLFDAFRSGPDGSPAFSLNYAQWLDNMRVSMYGNKKQTVSPYYGKLFDHYAPNGKLPPDKVIEFREKLQQITALEQRYGNDTVRMDAEFEKLINQAKEDKAKEILRQWPKVGYGRWTPLPPNPIQRIRVKSPDGKTGSIPASQWEEAQKAGYVRIE